MAKNEARTRFDATCAEQMTACREARGDEPPDETAAQHHERRIERLIDRLPAWMQGGIHRLRRPSLRWVRIPAAVLLIVGSFAAILPIFGLWMLPLGLILLAEDVPPLRRARDRLLDRIERHRPHWFNAQRR